MEKLSMVGQDHHTEEQVVAVQPVPSVLVTSGASQGTRCGTAPRHAAGNGRRRSAARSSPLPMS
jgi:hypothetical protein